MYDEDDLLPLAALQHLAFCERQWALIYLEGLWAENVLTTQGRQLHKKAAHGPQTEIRPDMRVARGLRVHSFRLGLSGVTDIVEFRRLAPGKTDGARLEGVEGLWQPFPVEYKRGRPKPGPCDEIQLCAQALCLEEMLGCAVPRGALFYGVPRRRTDVEFDQPLRDRTIALAGHLHRLTAEAKTPPPPPGKKCRNCSLRDICIPRAFRGANPREYLSRVIAEPPEEPT